MKKNSTKAKEISTNFPAIIKSITDSFFSNGSKHQQAPAMLPVFITRVMVNLLRKQGYPFASTLSTERICLLQVYLLIFQTTKTSSQRNEDTLRRMQTILQPYGFTPKDMSFLDQQINSAALQTDTNVFVKLYRDVCSLTFPPLQRDCNIDELNIASLLRHDPLAMNELMQVVIEYKRLLADLNMPSQAQLRYRGRVLVSVVTPVDQFTLNNEVHTDMRRHITSTKNADKTPKFPTLRKLHDKNKAIKLNLTTQSLMWFQTQFAAKYLLISLAMKDSLVDAWSKNIPDTYQAFFKELCDFVNGTAEMDDYIVAIRSLPSRKAVEDFLTSHPTFFDSLNKYFNNSQFNSLVRNWNIFFLAHIYEEQIRRSHYGSNAKLLGLVSASNSNISVPSHLGHLTCCISRALMSDPVYIDGDGKDDKDDKHFYERASIHAWLVKNPANPITNQKLTNPRLVSATAVAAEIKAFRAQAKKESQTDKDKFLPCAFKFNSNPFTDVELVSALNDDQAVCMWLANQLMRPDCSYETLLKLMEKSIKDPQLLLSLIYTIPELFEEYAKRQGTGALKLFKDMYAAGYIPSESNTDHNNIRAFLTECQNMPWVAECMLSRTNVKEIILFVTREKQFCDRFVFGELAHPMVLKNIMTNAVRAQNYALIQQFAQCRTAVEILSATDANLMFTMGLGSVGTPFSNQ